MGLFIQVKGESAKRNDSFRNTHILNGFPASNLENPQMIIIWGTKTGALGPDASTPAPVLKCGVCGKSGMFQPMKQSRYFTLFWIPVIPLGSNKAIQCPNCGSLFKPPKTV
jgi:hypothetical protein